MPGCAEAPHQASRYFGGAAIGGLHYIPVWPASFCSPSLSAGVTPLVYPTPPRCLWAAAISPGSKPSLPEVGTNN